MVMVQGLSMDVHGLADGLKGLVEAGLAKAAGQQPQIQRYACSLAISGTHCF